MALEIAMPQQRLFVLSDGCPFVRQLAGGGFSLDSVSRGVALLPAREIKPHLDEVQRAKSANNSIEKSEPRALS